MNIAHIYIIFPGYFVMQKKMTSLKSSIKKIIFANLQFSVHAWHIKIRVLVNLMNSMHHNKIKY